MPIYPFFTTKISIMHNYKQHYTKFFKNIVDKNVQLRYNYQKDYRYNCTLVRINKKHTGLLALCGRNLFAL